MTNLIILYLFGALISTGILVIWNYTFIRLHLFKRFLRNKEVETIEEFDDAVANEISPNLSELISCPLCLGFWTSLLVSLMIYWLNNLSIGFVVGSSFSWPLFILLFHYFFDKE